jgi:hypothetical protein
LKFITQSLFSAALLEIFPTSVPHQPQLEILIIYIRENPRIAAVSAAGVDHMNRLSLFFLAQEILLVFSVSAAQSQPSTLPVRVVIAEVGPRVQDKNGNPYRTERWNKDTINVTLQLRFINLTSKEIRIPICDTLGSGAVLFDKNFHYTSANLGMPEFGGGFSRVEYSWLEDSGKLNAHGVYDLNSLTFDIQPKAEHFMLIPLQGPNRPGHYQLTISFDNLVLRNLANSYATRSYKQNEVYFQTKTSIPVDISP